MSKVVIIDTDILIDSSRGIQEAKDCLLQLEQNFTLSISSVTKMELIIGCRNKRELNILENFLNRFQVIPINEQISDLATTLLKQYNLSHNLHIADSLIAATAMPISQ